MFKLQGKGTESEVMNESSLSVSGLNAWACVCVFCITWRRRFLYYLDWSQSIVLEFSAVWVIFGSCKWFGIENGNGRTSMRLHVSLSVSVTFLITPTRSAFPPPPCFFMHCSSPVHACVCVCVSVFFFFWWMDAVQLQSEMFFFWMQSLWLKQQSGAANAVFSVSFCSVVLLHSSGIILLTVIVRWMELSEH